MTTCNIRNTFFERDTSNWTHQIHTIIKTKDDQIHSYYLEPFPETYEDALLKKTTKTKTQSENFFRRKNKYIN